MDENEGWNKRLGDNMLLAMLRNLLMPHLDKTIYVTGIDNLLTLLIQTIAYWV